VEADRGYVIFPAPGAKLYRMRMVREDGKWEAGGITAAELVPSS